MSRPSISHGFEILSLKFIGVMTFTFWVIGHVTSGCATCGFSIDSAFKPSLYLAWLVRYVGLSNT